MGVSGLRTALDLAREGINVTLLEKERFIGGFVRRLPDVNPVHRPGREVVEDLYRKLSETEKATILADTELAEISGSIGHFKVKFRGKPRHIREDVDAESLRKAETECPVDLPDSDSSGYRRRKAIVLPGGRFPDRPYIDMENCTRCGVCQRLFGSAVAFDERPVEFEDEFSIVVQATGFQPYIPGKGEFGYGESNRMLTLPEFLSLADASSGEMRLDGLPVRDVAFIYCVGSRQTETGGERKYCSRYCCTATLNADSYIKERFGSGINSYHFYRDIRAYGLYETMYEKASREKSLLIRYDPLLPPSVSRSADRMILVVKDTLSGGREVEVAADIVVLVTGMVPNEDCRKLSAALKVSASGDGFVQELHPKLRPVETTVGGILVGGAAQGPKDSHEAMISGRAAAAKASTLLMKGYTELEPFVVSVDENKCNGCVECVAECPAGAISMADRGEGRLRKSTWRCARGVEHVQPSAGQRRCSLLASHIRSCAPW